MFMILPIKYHVELPLPLYSPGQLHVWNTFIMLIMWRSYRIQRIIQSITESFNTFLKFFFLAETYWESGTIPVAPRRWCAEKQEKSSQSKTELSICIKVNGYTGFVQPAVWETISASGEWPLW